MAKNAETIKEKYEKNLKAADYVAWLKERFNIDGKAFRIPLEFYYNVLQSGRFQGSRMLDIGSGPVVHNVASASVFFPNILMCDYVKDNCEELKRWLRGQSTLDQFVLDIPVLLEGYGSDLKAGRKILEDRIRKCVKQVLRCDILKNNVFLEDIIKPEVNPPYDLVMSTYCLEPAAPTLEDYVLALKRINKLMKIGGGLMLSGSLQRKFWKMPENDFQYLQVSEEDVRKALSDSGFRIVDMKVHEKFEIDNDDEGTYDLAAEKIQNI